MPPLVSLCLGVALTTFVVAGSTVGPAAAADAVAWPQADRNALEQLLGTGVIGDAVVAGPLTAADIPLKEGTWTYQVVAGKTNPEIARKMLVSRDTVKTHLSHVYTKLGFKNRSELAAAAARRFESDQHH